MKQIAQGAEAIIYEDKDTIVKDRIVKAYRHPSLDASLRKSRTKREVKIIKKLLALNFPVPDIIEEKDSKIIMQRIKGDKLRDIFEGNYAEYAKEIGKKIAKLHENDIIHGDLTTSNMILDKEIYFIDFGLSYTSTKVEDRAVDLHLLKQAIESTHYTICEDAFHYLLEGYASYTNSKEVLDRLDTVESRGRNKGKGS